MSLWNRGSGKAITGNPDDAFVQGFQQIPDGTIAEAFIKSFVLFEDDNQYSGKVDQYYLVTYKLLNGDFKGYEVRQKIKIFSGNPEQIDRNLNMLMLIFKLCDFTWVLNRDPLDDDLAPLQNKVLSIKINEWQMPKNDGSGMMQGNFVSEVYKAGDVPTKTGTKLDVDETISASPPSTALNRNANKAPSIDDDSDIPF